MGVSYRVSIYLLFVHTKKRYKPFEITPLFADYSLFYRKSLQYRSPSDICDSVCAQL